MAVLVIHVVQQMMDEIDFSDECMNQPSTYDVSYLAFFVVFEIHCVLERIGISPKGYVH